MYRLGGGVNAVLVLGASDGLNPVLVDAKGLVGVQYGSKNK